MTDTPELAAALSEFQGEMPTVTKGNKATVPTKTGGQYTYTYADLADVTQAAMPLLAKYGLAFTAESGYESGQLILRGVLMHKSGQERSGILPLAGDTPQALGSSITYMRRYLLGCLTGIVTDDDDDGQNATRAPARKAAMADAFPKGRPAPTPVQEPPTLDSAAPEKMTPRTRGHLFALLHDKGIPDAEQLSGINYVLGLHDSADKYTSRAGLSEVDACRVIDYLRTLPEPEQA